jgi:uncharacterized membrane protein YoaK (UPF0700 family)
MRLMFYLIALGLPFVGGLTNTFAFLHFSGLYVANHTGNVNKFILGLAQQQIVVSALSLCLAYFSSGALTAYTLETYKKNNQAWSLQWPLQGIFACMLASLWLPHPLWLATAMGAQNVLTSKITKLLVRSTHLTGWISDLAIHTVNYALGQRHAELLARLKTQGLFILGFATGVLLAGASYPYLQIYTLVPGLMPIIGLWAGEVVRGISAEDWGLNFLSQQQQPPKRQ